jgi:S-adenosylmethionine-diacylglycerol 3-amino-3-carboxypropyl transferase
MSAERLSFAVVREDPEVERALLERALEGPARAALVVASGGCTALSLAATMPDLSVSAFDINPAQLAHCARKYRVASSSDADLAALNVADDSERALNQCGEFERLFRVLRAAIESLVAPRREVESFFDEIDGASRASTLARWTRSPYWEPVFHSVFHGAMLEAMFGFAATQHAEPGSYPRYFQRAFERGLSREDAGENYFLHHVLLGRYLPRALPPYVATPPRVEPRWILGSLDAIDDLPRYDLISLSNVLDWSDATQTERWARALRGGVRVGAIVLVRQLNNQRDLRAPLGEDFALDAARSDALTAAERSLFYERVLVFRRVRGGPA